MNAPLAPTLKKRKARHFLWSKFYSMMEEVWHCGEASCPYHFWALILLVTFRHWGRLILSPQSELAKFDHGHCSLCAGGDICCRLSPYSCLSWVLFLADCLCSLQTVSQIMSFCGLSWFMQTSYLLLSFSMSCSLRTISDPCRPSPYSCSSDSVPCRLFSTDRLPTHVLQTFSVPCRLCLFLTGRLPTHGLLQSFLHLTDHLPTRALLQSF